MATCDLCGADVGNGGVMQADNSLFCTTCDVHQAEAAKTKGQLQKLLRHEGNTAAQVAKLSTFWISFTRIVIVIFAALTIPSAVMAIGKIVTLNDAPLAKFLSIAFVCLGVFSLFGMCQVCAVVQQLVEI